MQHTLCSNVVLTNYHFIFTCDCPRLNPFTSKNPVNPTLTGTFIHHLSRSDRLDSIVFGTQRSQVRILSQRLAGILRNTGLLMATEGGIYMEIISAFLIAVTTGVTCHYGIKWLDSDHNHKDNKNLVGALPL